MSRDWLAPQRVPVNNDDLPPLPRAERYWEPGPRQARLDAEIERRGLRPGSSWLDVCNDTAERARLSLCEKYGLKPVATWDDIHHAKYRYEIEPWHRAIMARLHAEALEEDTLRDS
jgi:hypothetical protein